LGFTAGLTAKDARRGSVGSTESANASIAVTDVVIASPRQPLSAAVILASPAATTQVSP
jgi:hypothetical protein